MNVLQYILGLGPQLFVPFILMVIGLVFGLGVRNSVRSGITVGIGFMGMGLVGNLLGATLSPVVKVMVEKLGLNLIAIDIGAGPIASMAFSSLMGITLIPIIIGINIILIFFRMTKTLNVDIYNFYYFIIAGIITYAISGSFAFGIIAGIAHAMLSLKMADLTADRLGKVIGFEGVSIPHGFASASVPLFLALDKIYDHIPFLNRSAEKQVSGKEMDLKKFDFLGDPVLLGFFMGVVFGGIAGNDLKGILGTALSTAAVLMLYPRMVKLIVEGLIPISDAARKFVTTRFKDRQLYVGLDSAVTLGHPTTVNIGILMIPVFMIYAAILPKNITLPLAEVPFAAFYICMATVAHRGDKLRTFISGLIFIPLVLYMSGWAAPYITQMGKDAGINLVAEGQMATTTAMGNLFIWFPSFLSHLPVVGTIFTVLIVALTYFFGLKYEKKERV